MDYNHKFEIIKEIKRNDDYLIAIAKTDDGRNKFIKSALNEAGEKIIKREYANQLFLRELSKSHDCGFIFLKPEIENNVIIFPDLSDETEWLGEENPEKKNFLPKIAPVENYLENFIKLEKVLHEVSFADLPEEIKKDHAERQQMFKENFEKNSKYLFNKGLIDAAYQNTAQDAIDKYSGNLAYQHHDVLPWHIAKGENGQLILIDAGWAGWSLKYFDFAYYILQMAGYAQSYDDANKLLARARIEFATDPNFENILAANILYRSTKLARELNEQHNSRQAADRVIGYVKELYKIK